MGDADDQAPYGARVPHNDELASRTAQLWAAVEEAQVAVNRALDARDDAVRAQHTAGEPDSHIADAVNRALGAPVATSGNVRQIRNRDPLSRRPATVQELRAARER